MKLPRAVSGEEELAKGTLSAILSIAGQHLQLGKEQVLSKLKL